MEIKYFLIYKKMSKPRDFNFLWFFIHQTKKNLPDGKEGWNCQSLRSQKKTTPAYWNSDLLDCLLSAKIEELTSIFI